VTLTVTVSPVNSGFVEICKKYTPSIYPDTKNFLWEDESRVDTPGEQGYITTFKAIPSPGYMFDHWEGFLSGDSLIVSHELTKSDDEKTVTAVFIKHATEGACKSSAPIQEDIIIVSQWSGDYPVGQLARLPQGQRATPVGYIVDAETLGSVWQVFKPEEQMPVVDFDADLIVFVRNVDFYNRISISRCTAQDGVAEILAVQTMSAMPIEDKAGMSLAVIPRAGLRFIKARGVMVPVTDKINTN